MRIKQELEEVNCDCNEKRQIFTRLQSDVRRLLLMSIVCSQSLFDVLTG